MLGCCVRFLDSTIVYLSKTMNFGLTYLDEADFQERILNSYKKIKNNKKLRKYYWKRYQLFTKFDDGILLDSKESWYSVTPEKVAEHIALKCFNALDCNPNLVVLGKSQHSNCACAHQHANGIEKRKQHRILALIMVPLDYENLAKIIFTALI
jgi:hypothetical protein